MRRVTEKDSLTCFFQEGQNIENNTIVQAKLFPKYCGSFIQRISIHVKLGIDGIEIRIHTPGGDGRNASQHIINIGLPAAYQ